MRANFPSRRLIGVHLLVIIVVVAGCAAQPYAPRPLDQRQSMEDFVSRSPDAPAVRDYLAGEGVATADWPLPAWGLRELSLLAFLWHPDLSAARADADVTQAGIAALRQPANPELDAIIEHHEHRSGDDSPWSVGVALRIPVQASGKRAARVERAELAAAGAALDVGSVAWQLRRRVRESFVDVFAADREVETLRQELLWRREESAILERRHESGAESAREPHDAAARLSDVEFQLAQASGRSRSARLVLAEAVGLPAERMAELPLATLAPPAPVLDDASLQRTALSNRLDIRRGLLRYAAAESALRLEMDMPLPDLVFKPGYLWDQGANVWSLGLGLVLPLLHRNEGPIAEASARREAAAQSFAALQARAIHELDLASHRYAQATEALNAAERARHAAAVVAAAAQRSFAAGASDRLEFVRSRLDTLPAERRVLAAQRECQRALASLEDALQRPLDDVPSPRLATVAAPIVARGGQ